MKVQSSGKIKRPRVWHSTEATARPHRKKLRSMHPNPGVACRQHLSLYVNARITCVVFFGVTKATIRQFLVLLSRR